MRLSPIREWLILAGGFFGLVAAFMVLSAFAHGFVPRLAATVALVIVWQALARRFWRRYGRRA